MDSKEYLMDKKTYYARPTAAVMVSLLLQTT